MSAPDDGSAAAKIVPVGLQKLFAKTFQDV